MLLDLEGTTGASRFVRGVLFPYSRSRIEEWVIANAGRPEVAGTLDEVRRSIDDPGASAHRIAAVLADWIDRDVRTPALKELQGRVWAEGYTTGQFRAVVYRDVPAALARWKGLGLRVHIFSAGSELAQRMWFRHTTAGDLAELIDGYFDLRTGGPKDQPASYRTVVAALGTPAAEVLFLSDSLRELDAARAAGLRTLGVRRAEENQRADLTGHDVVTDFDGVDLESYRRG